MKVAIIETLHFQYGLTIAELFEDEEKVFFVTQDIRDKMHAYAPDLCNGRFEIIQSVGEAYERIIAICESESMDLLFMNPIFQDFHEIDKIALRVKCTTVITIHCLNYWFRSKYRTLKYYRERRIKQKIVKSFDYIATEELVFNYLEVSTEKTFADYRFLNIPWTLYRPRDFSLLKREHPERLKVVLPGSIDNTRRQYDELLVIIDRFAEQHAPITFSFAGPAIGNYGLQVINRLTQLNAKHPGVIRYYPPNSSNIPELFTQEMGTADLAISTLNVLHTALGTPEYYGRTKATGFTCDIVSYQLPGLLPAHLKVPPGLVGSAFNYSSYPELEQLLSQIMNEPETLRQWQDQAKLNSKHYTAEVIRKDLPFFLHTANRG